MRMWFQVRNTRLLVPVCMVLLALDFALAGQTVVLTRILGMGANTVDVVQFCVAPLATCVIVLLTSGNALRERGSYGRAQVTGFYLWLLASLLAGVVPFAVGLALNLSSLRVAGVSFLGLLGLAAIIAQATLPTFGAAAPIAYLALSLVASSQVGGASDPFWPISIDVSWSWAWNALLLWVAGCGFVLARPPLRHCSGG